MHTGEENLLKLHSGSKPLSISFFLGFNPMEIFLLSPPSVGKNSHATV